MSAIYLASRFSRRVELLEYRTWLEGHGHTVVSRWLDNHEEVGIDNLDALTPEERFTHPEAQRFAVTDVEDVERADWLISFTGRGGSGGRHVEFGIAVARGIRLTNVGPLDHVFHNLPSVERFPDWDRFVAAQVQP